MKNWMFKFVQVDRSRGFPLLRFRDRESYAGNKTKEYDDLAMRYFSYVLYPLVACFAIYSLIYEQHKSWYSWILSSLTSCVYMFGKWLLSCIYLQRPFDHLDFMVVENQDSTVAVILPVFWNRFHHDVSTAIHQLQAEISGSYAMASNDLQVPQHNYWWPVCICHQDANSSSPFCVPRWYLFYFCSWKLLTFPFFSVQFCLSYFQEVVKMRSKCNSTSGRTMYPTNVLLLEASYIPLFAVEFCLYYFSRRLWK